MYRLRQANRASQTSQTGQTCPRARLDQKPKNRKTPLKGLSHLFTLSPFHPFLNAKGVCPVCRLKYLLKKLGLGKFKASDMAATVS